MFAITVVEEDVVVGHVGDEVGGHRVYGRGEAGADLVTYRPCSARDMGFKEDVEVALGREVCRQAPGLDEAFGCRRRPSDVHDVAPQVHGHYLGLDVRARVAVRVTTAAPPHIAGAFCYLLAKGDPGPVLAFLSQEVRRHLGPELFRPCRRREVDIGAVGVNRGGARGSLNELGELHPRWAVGPIVVHHLTHSDGYALANLDRFCRRVNNLLA